MNYRANYYQKNKKRLREQQISYRNENKEKVRLIERAYHQNNPDQKIGETLRARCKRVGVTVEYYNNLPKRCSLEHCDSKVPGGIGDWNLDHDHKTGKFRGLLCRKHNMGLGLFKDSVVDLQDAIKYLQRSM